MQVLLTNDDGINAPGLKALEQSIVQWATRSGRAPIELTVVAPDRGRSECGHSVTDSSQLCVSEVAPNWYAINGTPVDCVRVALACFCPDADLVLSGINAGANVGVDILMSGTVAAAREAAIHGRPAIAISHYRRPEIAKTWSHATDWLEPVYSQFVNTVASNGLVSDDGNSIPFWNVNLPAVEPGSSPTPPIVECVTDPIPLQRTGRIARLEDGPQGLQETPVQLRSDFHGRERKPGCDVQQCFDGKITISKLKSL